jgi:Na+/phosphate symporter
MVKKQLKKVDNLDRENLLQYNTKKLNNRVPLVITYSKALPNIHEILNKNMKILYNRLLPAAHDYLVF